MTKEQFYYTITFVSHNGKIITRQVKARSITEAKRSAGAAGRIIKTIISDAAIDDGELRGHA
jgi:hypothetical protein